ncbi:transposase [Umezakia ovalisporum]|uniref:transposase n=1 Tax=Umezakia ovalisporum TaxID=75695 RepID=UPI0035B8F8D5
MHKGNVVSLLDYHLVFIPKPRKKVLTGGMAQGVQQIINLTSRVFSLFFYNLKYKIAGVAQTD